MDSEYKLGRNFLQSLKEQLTGLDSERLYKLFPKKVVIGKDAFCIWEFMGDIRSHEDSHALPAVAWTTFKETDGEWKEGFCHFPSKKLSPKCERQ